MTPEPPRSRASTRRRLGDLFRRRHRSPSANELDDSVPPEADESSRDSAQEHEPVATDTSDGDWNHVPPTESRFGTSWCSGATRQR